MNLARSTIAKVWGHELTRQILSGQRLPAAVVHFAKSYPSVPTTGTLQILQRSGTIIFKVGRYTRTPDEKGNAPSTTAFVYLTKAEAVEVRNALTELLEN